MEIHQSAQRRHERDRVLLEIAGAIQVERGSGVLAIVDVNNVSAIAVARARALARSLEQRLTIVGVASTARREWNGLPCARRRLASAVADRVPDVPSDLEVAFGSATEVAIAAGLRAQPSLIVLPDSVDGHAAVAIATTTDVPVLVARVSRRNGQVVGATRMANLRYPVLVATAQMARALNMPSTFVHYSSRTQASDAAGVRGLAIEAATAKRARLDLLASWTVTRTATVITNSHVRRDLVEMSEARNADIVCVGARRHSWFDRARVHFAAEIVDDCRCTVLVVPMERA